jgi:hypothetical protein
MKVRGPAPALGEHNGWFLEQQLRGPGYMVREPGREPGLRRQRLRRDPELSRKGEIGLGNRLQGGILMASAAGNGKWQYNPAIKCGVEGASKKGMS